MLEVIRENAQSWGVKAIFAVIILVFVFWGVGGFRANRKAILAKVDDHEIRTKDFFAQYQRELEGLRRQNKKVNADTLKKMHFKKQLFERMVRDYLLTREAQKLGLTVSPRELSAQIKSMAAFQDKDKHFDVNRYKGLLAANQFTPAQFEYFVRVELLRKKLEDLLLSPVEADTTQAKELFDFVQTEVKLEYLHFAKADYLDQVQVSDKEIKEFYKAHQERFKAPAQMSMDYLLLTPEGLAKIQKVSEDEIKKYYEQNKGQFYRQEQVKARHILLKLAPDASKEEENKVLKRIEKIRKRVLKGEDFVKLAKEFSEGPSASRGGDLGWFKRGEMVKSFEQAAFALKKGEVSKPVRTRFGYHLIKVEARVDKKQLPLAFVRETIENKLAVESAADHLEDVLDQALEEMQNSGDLSKVAKSLGVEVQHSGLFDQEHGPKGLKLKPEDIQVLFAMKKGELTDSPIIVEDGYLLVQKTGEVPAHVLSLDKVKADIRRQLKEDKAFDSAQKAAQACLEKLQKEERCPQKEIKESGEASRQGFIPSLGYNVELVKDVFGAQKGKWLPKSYRVQDGYVLARQKEIIPAAKEQWKKQKDFWVQNLSRLSKEDLRQAFENYLRQEAKVEILLPEVLQD